MKLHHALRRYLEIAWRGVVNAGVSGSDIRDIMLEAVERRFGTYRAPAVVEMLSDNGSPYIATYRGEDVVRTLERVCAQGGYHRTIRVDNGREFISRDLDLWAYANEVTLDFSRPGKPADNGFIEAFNSKLRSECLNARRHCRSDQWRGNGNFKSLADAQEKLETWRRHYNEDRPHSAIG